MISLVKYLGKNLLVWQIQAWHWSPVMSCIIYGLEKSYCLRGDYRKPSSSVWRKLFSRVTVKKEYMGEIQGDTLMDLKPWSLSVLWILGPLHWFCYLLKSHSGGSQVAHWALKPSSISWSASSKNMNGFHQLQLYHALNTHLQSCGKNRSYLNIPSPHLSSSTFII